MVKRKLDKNKYIVPANKVCLGHIRRKNRNYKKYFTQSLIFAIGTGIGFLLAEIVLLVI